MYIDIHRSYFKVCTPVFELSHLSQMWVHPALATADVSIFLPMLPWPLLVPYWE